MTAASDTGRLWRHIYGDLRGHVCIAAADRTVPKGSPGAWREQFYAYPVAATFAEGQIAQHDALGHDTYFSAHLLTDKRRTKQHAAPA